MNDNNAIWGNTLETGLNKNELKNKVTSVNGQTGDVELTASDVGAATEQFVKDAIANIELPEVSGGGAFTEYVLMDITLEEEVSRVEIVPTDSEEKEKLKNIINECDEAYFLAQLYKPTDQAEGGAFELFIGDGSTSQRYGIGGNAYSPSSNAPRDYYDSVAYFHFNRNSQGFREIASGEQWVTVSEKEYNFWGVTGGTMGNHLRPADKLPKVCAKTTTSFGVGSRFVVIARMWNR